MPAAVTASILVFMPIVINVCSHAIIRVGSMVLAYGKMICRHAVHTYTTSVRTIVVTNLLTASKWYSIFRFTDASIVTLQKLYQ